MAHYTVILMPDSAGAVRRFRVRIASPHRLLGAVLGAALALAAISADWVRLRLDRLDVAQLRAELAARQELLHVYSEQMQVYAGKVHEFESQLASLREFERRVRVIANLPRAGAEPPLDAAALQLGVGGGADDPADATPPIGAPTGANARSGRPAAPGPNRDAEAPLEAAGEPVSSAAPPTPAQWAGIQAWAQRLSSQALQQQSSLQRLIEQLRGKAERLASTPSIWPAKGWLTSRFGYRISPFTGLRDFHGGIDIAAEPGTEIVAPARGRVVFAGNQGRLGRVIVLDHGFGVRTTFGHARDLWAQTGQTVERGQAIASIGNSGLSTGPHLHYAIERNRRLTNPIDYIVE